MVVSVGEMLSVKGANRPGLLPGRGDDQWIAQGFDQHGPGFLAQVDGTFALAFWQSKSETLTLATDRRSDMPLFYRQSAGQLVFSSWLALLMDGTQEIDPSTIQEFLRFFYIAAPRTLYRGICRIEPGYYVTVSGNGIEIQECDREVHGDWHVGNDHALEEFQELFESAIERRIGDRRVGVFLSSGVDSATLLAGCQRTCADRVEAFTIGFDNAELDEANTARAYAKCLGVPHTVFRFNTEEYRQAFDQAVRGFDTPFADPAGLPLTLGSGLAKDRVEVITGGTGGDDLFGAPMPRHLKFSVGFAARLPVGLRRDIGRALAAAPIKAWSSYAPLFDFVEAEELLVTWRGWSKTELEELLGRPVEFENTGFYRMFRRHKHKGAQQLYDALGVFPPDDCRFEAAGLAGLPIELPYHDKDLYKFVNSLPESFRMHQGVSKVLLRKLYARYFPPELASAKKHYFNMPLQELMSHDDFEIVRTYLARDVVARTGVVDSSRAWEWIERYIAGDHTLLFKIWALAFLHAWLAARN